MASECQKVYFLTLWLHGIFYYVLLCPATCFLVLGQMSYIFFEIWVNSDVFLPAWMFMGILSKSTLFDIGINHEED